MIQDFKRKRSQIYDSHLGPSTLDDTYLGLSPSGDSHVGLSPPGDSHVGLFPLGLGNGVRIFSAFFHSGLRSDPPNIYYLFYNYFIL